MLNSEMISLPNLLIRIWNKFSRRRRCQFILVMILMLISAFAEVIALGAVLPFLGILTAPEKVFNNPIISDIALEIGITSADQLVLPLTIMFAALALIAGLIRILLLWASTRIAYATGADISIEVYRRTLYQPYQVHLARNSSEVISIITNKAGGTANVLQLLLISASSIVLLFAIMFALFAIDPTMALVSIISFGISYGIITWLSRKKLRHNSQRIAYEQTQVLKAMQEGLGGIRDVLLDNTQPLYCDIFRQADIPLRRAQANNIVIGGTPRFAMEAFGMILIAFLAYVISLQSDGISSALPVLGALALGAQRLLPALQLIYSSWANIVGSHASLADVVLFLDQPLPQNLITSSSDPLHFNDNIRFKDVRFRYKRDEPWVLDGLNLNIPRGARVGFVGSTGSGKSTTLDLMMGLLIPTEGQFLVDGQHISGELIRTWQKTIAHVPQNIFLSDATLAENIAFGVSIDDIDMDRVQNAARQAQIADFIESNSEAYQSFAGERGVRLSGGQRQRIGIARALYKQARVLVFDEATSALDNATEHSVMAAIEGLGRNITIFLIAHRLTTVQRCDIIVELEGGKVRAQGTYEELLKNSPSFRKMASSV